MLFDLFDIPKEIEYEHWINRINFVASTLEYDYFKLWEIPEAEFIILERYANELIEKRQKKLDEIKNNK